MKNKIFNFQFSILHWLLLIALSSLLTAACSSTKKNISVAKTETDSSSLTEKKATSLHKIDSLSTKKDSATWSKETTISYVPVWVPKGTIAPGYVTLATDSPDTVIILVPSINIKEAGNSKKEERTEVHKKDTTSAQEKVATTLQKKETVKQKEVKRFKFLPWYWLIIAGVVLIIYLKIKKIL